MRCKDYDYYGMMPEFEDIRKRKRPNVFIYQQISDECGIYEVRVGGGHDVSNLPPFKIFFTIPEGDFVMVKYAKPDKKIKLSPHSDKTEQAEAKQEEMPL
ncbi:MAG: hypothetical protein ABJH28_12495 [Paraglaciecola sp.]|uniref:hypothetical protein n=1 Tax=Paraglaciecola sp. TaxID=1920173 RepID=UPI00326630E5